MSNDKSDMPDVMFVARDEMSNDHYLAGDNREEGDTEYVRRSLVDEYKTLLEEMHEAIGDPAAYIYFTKRIAAIQPQPPQAQEAGRPDPETEFMMGL